LKALLIVDMQKDNLFKEAASIIPKIKALLEKARLKGFLIVYLCDSRYPDDSLFKRLGMKPHALKGSEGAKIIEELSPKPREIIVEKRLLSGFFGTDLDFTLREKKVDTVIVVGIATDVCLLKTALDAFELGYQVIVPQDACASLSMERHEAALKILDNLKIPLPLTENLLENL